MSQPILVAMLAVLLAVLPISAQQQTPLPGSAISQFIDPLPTLSVAGGSIATVVAGASDIEMHMREFRATMLPSSFVAANAPYAGTWVWGYTVGPNPPSLPSRPSPVRSWSRRVACPRSSDS
jgi:hypothetical protein